MGCHKRDRELDLGFSERVLSREAKLRIARIKNINPDNVEASLYPEIRRWAEPDVVPSVEYSIMNGEDITEQGRVSFEQLRKGKLYDAGILELLQHARSGEQDYPIAKHSNFRQNYNLDKVLKDRDLTRAEAAGGIATTISVEGRHVYPYNIELLGAYSKDKTPCKDKDKNIMIEYAVHTQELRGRSQVPLDELFRRNNGTH